MNKYLLIFLCFLLFEGALAQSKSTAQLNLDMHISFSDGLQRSDRKKMTKEKQDELLKNITSEKYLKEVEIFSKKDRNRFRDLFEGMLIKCREDKISLDSCLYCYKKGLVRAKDLSFDTLAYHHAVEIALSYVYLDQKPDSVLIYVNEVDQIFSKNENGLLDFKPYFYNYAAGIIFKHVMDDYATAIEYYFKSIDACKATSVYSVARPLNNVSKIYLELGDYANAIKYIREVIKHSEGMEEKKALPRKAYAYETLSSVYNRLDQKDSVELYITKALSCVSRLDTIKSYTSTKVNVYGGAFSFYKGEENYEEADFYYEKLFPLRDANRYYIYRLFLEYYIQKNEMTKADSMVANYFDYFRPSTLANYYEAIGDYKNAFLYRDSAALDMEKDLNERNVKYAAIANAQFETLKKEEQITTLEKDKLIQAKTNNLLLLSILGLIGIVGVLAWYYRQNKLKRELVEKDLENQKTIAGQAKELKKLDQLKSRFFANIAHELRTPITLIQGPVQKIMSGKASEKEQQELLKLANDNSQNLLGMVNQILDLTKSEVGDVKVKLSKFFLQDWLNELIQEFQIITESKGIQFFPPVYIPENLQLVTDIRKLNTIIKNLLTNAVKYSNPEGKIIFTVTQIQGQIQFVVQDNGRGIAPEDLPHIFDRYYQTKNVQIAAEGGVGIGLSLCKEYAKNLEGKIEVNSSLGNGSDFILTIPQQLEHLATDELNEVIFNGAISLKEEKSPFKIQDTTLIPSDYILIVEDNLEMCNYLKLILQDENNVEFAHHGKEALAKIKAQKPIAIITDLMMPIMDGLELTEMLKQDTAYKDIPILMLTAKSNIADRNRALRLGIEDYLLKPFKEESLIASLNHLVQLSESRTKETTYKEIIQKEEKEIYSIAKRDTDDRVKDAPTSSSQTLTIEPNDEWVDQLRQFVLDEVDNFDLDLAKLQDELAISSTHLYRKVKELTGMAPKQFIKEVRLQEARRMIEEREYHSVKAVAYSIGFRSENNFSKNFKKRFGVLPSKMFNSSS